MPLSPLDHLMAVAAQALAPARRFPVPKEIRIELGAAAEALGEAISEGEVSPYGKLAAAEDLLMHAALAVSAYPEEPQALAALDHARALVVSLRAPAPPEIGPARLTRWEQEGGPVR